MTIARHPRRSFTLALLIVAAAGVPAGAGEPAASFVDEPSISAVSAELLTVQKSLQNARIKLKSGIVSGPGADARADHPDTPAFRCCASNIEQMLESVQLVLAHVDGLARRSAAEDDDVALGQLELIHHGSMALGQGLEAFARATSKERARAALDGLIAPFHETTSGVRGLGACCGDRMGPSANQSDVDQATQGASAASKKQKGKARRAKRQ